MPRSSGFHRRRRRHSLVPAAVAATALSAGALLLRAQNAPTTQPAAAAAAAAAAAPTTRPTTAPSTRPVERITLNFKDAALDAVLDHLSATAGFVVVKEAPVDGRVTVLSQQPVSPEEAVVLLNAVLKANGFTAIRQDGGRVLRIVQREKAKKGSVPVHFGADPASIAETEEIITQVIPLRNVDAAKLKTDLQPMFSPEADVTAAGGSNAIIITDSSANVRRVAKIISGLDERESILSDLRIVQLKHANASAAAKLITTVFKSEPALPQGQPGMPMQPGQPMPPGGGAPAGRIPGGGVDQALRGGKVTAAADERTNTLVITAPVETLKVIDNLLAKLDENPSNAFAEIRAYHLNNAEAESTSKLISSMFQPDENQGGGNDDFPFFSPRFGGRGADDKPIRFKVTTAFDERTNTVIVSAPASVHETVDKLVKDLDANPVATADLKVFHLEHATAFDVADQLDSIFNPKNRNDDDNGFIRFLFLGNGPKQKGRKMTAVADDRTNSVIVTAPTELLKAIGDVIQTLDSNPASEEKLFIYRLKNAQADNLEYVLNTLFGNTEQQGGGPQQGGPNQGFNQRGNGNGDDRQFNRSGRSRSSRRNNGNNGGGRNARNGGGNNGNRRGGGGGGNFPGVPQNVYHAITELTGEVFVVADLDTNSLIVTTATKHEAKVREIIDELDRPVPQVLIKVLIAEVTHDNSADYGVDFSILNQRSSGLGQTGGTNFGNAAPGNGGLVVSVLESRLNATLHALAQSGKLEVLSRPYVLASDNQLASITVGQEVPFIDAARTTEAGNQIVTFHQEDIGIILDVTPHINPDGLVILDVAPEISQLTDSTVALSDNVNAPIINIRSAESRVGVKSGETIVIGGLMEDRRNDTVQKVPLLGDIPGLGLIFSRTRTSKTKTELLIFLTPHVAEQPEALRPMSEDELGGTKLTPSAVQPGMFNEHLKGMERGRRPTSRPATAPTTRPAGIE